MLVELNAEMRTDHAHGVHDAQGSHDLMVLQAITVLMAPVTIIFHVLFASWPQAIDRGRLLSVFFFSCHYTLATCNQGKLWSRRAQLMSFSYTRNMISNINHCHRLDIKWPNKLMANCETHLMRMSVYTSFCMHGIGYYKL